MKAWLKGRNPLWASDFDGTLVHLNPDPNAVKLSREGVETLTRLVAKHDCALISGRKLEDLMAHAPLENFSFAGNHGAQLRARDGSEWQWHSDNWERWRRERLAEVEKLARLHDGRLEDKGLSITLHFRGSSHEAWWKDEAPAELSGLLKPWAQLLAGVASWNVTAVDAPNKATAVAKLCLEGNHDSVIYFGDEPTDEHVFRLHGRLPVFGVKVGPGESAALYRLESPDQVLEVLRDFV